MVTPFLGQHPRCNTLKHQWTKGISPIVIQILLYDLNPYEPFSKCAHVRVYR